VKDGFDVLYREGKTQPKMISLGLHMRLIGHPSRAAGLERALDYIDGHRGVWITRASTSPSTGSPHTPRPRAEGRPNRETDMGKLTGRSRSQRRGAGQGAAEAETFAREGAKVVFGDILDAEGKEGRNRHRAGGGEAAYVHSGRHERGGLAERRQAGDRPPWPARHPDQQRRNRHPAVAIEDRTAAEWDRVMAVNAKGVFLGTKYAIPAMRQAGGGSIVNISSVAGIGQSLHQEPAYAASKGAIRIFTKVTASQHAKDRIRCNSVHPGPVDTEMLHSAMPDPEVLRRRLERVRWGEWARWPRSSAWCSIWRRTTRPT